MKTPIFLGQHDPADVAAYAVSFADLLIGNETVAIQSVILDQVSQAAGLAIGANDYGPVAVGNTVRFWMTCSQPGNAAFDTGLQAAITIRVQTSSSPPSLFERSALLLVKQSFALPAPPVVPAAVDVLRQRLSQANDARHRAMTTGQITDVWRDGRRIRYSAANTADLDSYIRDLTSQIIALDPGGPEATSATPRRRAIGVRF